MPRPMSIICSAVRGKKYADFRGAWRSPVARLLWEQKVGGSNPLAPTKKTRARNKPRAPVAQMDRAAAF